ncbi:DUF3696 domain-containing protein [Thermococcus sp. 21S9]|uniref:DUF3696 domain-containing protein n=1 Tax=Thermococcus sp. 21S9 TaxID=1638223 RepID=UPI00143B45FF|nr:DUF3696 domain-containing protein [Thermococcus sp. 21S9]NJE55408.1 DUF3696 domain-containing protein [Thermococcus sp. 21S9]
MIEDIKVKNFKSFSDTGKKKIKPITILIGPNSSGKSSFIQFLLLLKQTIESTSRDSPLVLNGRYVQLGSFREIIHKQRVRKSIEFEFSVRLDNVLNDLRYRIRYRRDNFLRYLHEYGDTITYKSKIRYVKPPIKGVVPTLRLQEFEIQLNSEERRNTSFKVVFKFDSKNQKYEVYINDKKAGKLFQKAWVYKTTTGRIYNTTTTIHPINFYILAYMSPILDIETPSEFSEGEILVAEFLLDSVRTIEKIMKKIYYIGPLRERPKRYYILSGDVPLDVGPSGENALSTLLTSKRQEYLIKKVNEWLKKFDLAKQFQIKGIKSQILLEALVEDPIQGLKLNISDVGFGLSQILPIIIEGFHAPSDSIILIEQPEIHLHPKLQADMADLFIDIAKSGNRKLIIETHSEHIILRLQRRIIEGVIRPEDVAIYYFEMTKEGTNIQDISINELGELENWPKGFFEEDAREIIELTKARLNKIQKTSTHQKESS